MSKRIAPPSAHDVARLAGVSQAAVSRAFTPGASIAKGTQDKVLRAAKSLGYRPNLLARSLIMGQSGIVGVVYGGNPHNPFFMSVLDALLKRMSRARKHILIFTVEGHSTADEHVEDLLKYRVDALLLMATTLSAKLAAQCQDAGIPLIFFNRRPPRKDLANIIENDRAGARRIADHLLQQGYRRPAVITGLAESSTGREREAGFIAHLTSEGLAEPERECGYFQRDGALQAARKLLSAKPRPDAIYCVNDYMALAAMEVARYEFGLEIGRQIGIAGFDDIEQAAWPSFDLTTYAIPVEKLIEQAATLLLHTAGQEIPRLTLVEGVFKPRRSTQRK
jgi:DNA-binding LacI/PurR family transcriptional regulator